MPKSSVGTRRASSSSVSFSSVTVLSARVRRLRLMCWAFSVRFDGDWNYTLHPQHPLDATPMNSTADEPHRPTPRSLQEPALTGMTHQQLNELIATLTPALELQRQGDVVQWICRG